MNYDLSTVSDAYVSVQCAGRCGCGEGEHPDLPAVQR